ncbi:MAG: ExeA family protein, partial [Nevskiales bacterium]
MKDTPFSITPDPRYVYMSPHHREALGHLLYGTGEEGGFVQITGEVGTGKTTLIRTLLEQDMPAVDVALILNPRLNVDEFLAAICDELRIAKPAAPASLKQLVDVLNAHLLQTHSQGKRTVLIVDEAQHLNRDVLEQVRLLTNLETHRHKLLRIMLVGQPELRELLAREDLRQLAQRITARYHLDSLSSQQTREYVVHRLQVAGGRSNIFSTAALKDVYRITRGTPRLINVVCDRALLGAYGQGQAQVSRAILRQAAKEVFDKGEHRRAAADGPALWPWLAMLATSIVLGVSLY